MQLDRTGKLTIDISSRAGQAGAQPVVPNEPLFSPTALTLRSGSRVTTGAARLDFFWARNAIFHGLRALGLRPGEKVLVPAFVCAAAIEPIEYFGAALEFYAIRRDCTPDWRDLESKVHGDVRAILAIHYFGFPCDILRFRAFCDERNVLLIEDCAHVLEGVPNPYRLGEFGDFSVFSPRKYLPIFDGGTLRFNRPASGFQVRFDYETPLFTLRVAKNLFDRRKPPTAPLSVRPSSRPQPEQIRNERGWDIIEGRPQKPLYVPPDSTSFLPWMANVPMSRLSKRLLAHFPLAKIASKRRENYSHLVEEISHVDGARPLFLSLPPDVVPWVLPIIIADRRDMDRKLRALGIPAATWASVRHARVSASDFPEADFLYECLLQLPIHQDLERQQLDLMADAIATVAREG